MLALRRAQGGKVVPVQRRAGPARGPEVIRMNVHFYSSLVKSQEWCRHAVDEVFRNCVHLRMWLI